MAPIKMRRRRRPRQLELRPRTWGGSRPGAGRRPGPRPRVAHRRRPGHSPHHPAHVTLRARGDLGSLRSPRLFPAVRRAIAAAHRRDFRVVHFSVQGDHVHLIVEAAGRTALSSGVRGLAIRGARALNRALGRIGRVWDSRYHRRDLGSPREVRNALAYVLCNARKHGRAVGAIDPCSSARWFDGWRDRRPAPVDLRTDAPPVAAPRTFLLATGWRRHGLIATGGGLRASPHPDPLPARAGRGST